MSEPEKTVRLVMVTRRLYASFSVQHLSPVHHTGRRYADWALCGIRVYGDAVGRGVGRTCRNCIKVADTFDAEVLVYPYMPHGDPVYPVDRWRE